MITKEQKMLKELIEKTNQETVAGKLGISLRTLLRWVEGVNEPPYVARKYISQVYNGHKAQEVK